MRPRALVARFVLRPCHRRVRVLGEDFGQLGLGQRVELLQANDGRRRVAAVLALLGEVVVETAGAQQDARHRRRVGDRGVTDDGLEAARGELLNVGGRRREAQQLLGRERDEGLARALVGLRAQHVEVVCRRGGLDDPHVVLCGQLQVALDARARVVGSLALEAVGQEHDE